METKISSTRQTDRSSINQAIQESYQPEAKLVLFYVAKEFDYDYIVEKLNDKYPNAIIVGSIFHGQCDKSQGYIRGGLSILTVSDSRMKVKAVVIRDVKNRSLVYKEKILNAIKDVGIDPNGQNLDKKFFITTFIDAFTFSEERVLVMLNSLFRNKPLSIVGGSSGDFDTGACYLSLGNRVYEQSAILLFVNPGCKFITYSEMIFKPTGPYHYVTKASTCDRYLEEIDNMSIFELCAKDFGIPVEQCSIATLQRHPIIRLIGTNKLTVSAMSKKGKGISLAARVTIGNMVRFSEAEDTEKIAKETAAHVKNQFSKIHLILGFNCIFRYTQFQEERRCKSNYDILDFADNYFACTTLGEQFGYNQINQSLSLVVLGD